MAAGFFSSAKRLLSPVVVTRWMHNLATLQPCNRTNSPLPPNPQIKHIRHLAVRLERAADHRVFPHLVKQAITLIDHVPIARRVVQVGADMGLKANFPDDEIVPDQQSALPRRSGVGLAVEQGSFVAIVYPFAANAQDGHPAHAAPDHALDAVEHGRFDARERGGRRCVFDGTDEREVAKISVLAFPPIVFNGFFEHGGLESVLKSGVEGGKIHALVRVFHAAVGDVVVIETTGRLPPLVDLEIDMGVQQDPKIQRQAKKQVGRVGAFVVHFGYIRRAKAQLETPIQASPRAYQRFHVWHDGHTLPQDGRVVKMGPIHRKAAFGDQTILTDVLFAVEQPMRVEFQAKWPRPRHIDQLARMADDKTPVPLGADLEQALVCGVLRHRDEGATQHQQKQFQPGDAAEAAAWKIRWTHGAEFVFSDGGARL